jgi:ribosomal protein S18 acetylase RimI-like enzyme
MTTPAITLEPMTDQELKAWLEPTVRDFAQQKIRSGEYSAEDAMELATLDFLRLLPDGVHTKDNYLYTVRDVPGGEQVGVLWIALRPKAGKTEAFIYEIVVNEDRRGRGYGRATMLACAERARELGANSVGLHVFGHNSVARGLYTSLGFRETDVVMSLPLEADGD